MATPCRPGKRLIRDTLRALPWLGAFLAGVGTSQARDFCADIVYLIDQSRSGFADVMDERNGDSGAHENSPILDSASYCRVTKTLRGSAYHCGWEFPHRAQEAYDRFDDLVRRVDACIGRDVVGQNDRNVNHPDTYALRRYETPRAEVSVSLKDKSALEQTFVFIRIQDGQSH
jgi:hypothetical protein